MARIDDTTTGTFPVAKQATGKRLAALMLGAIGVVYGDIGTSPLYAIKACFNSKVHPLEVTTANIFGVMSLVFWALALIISVKYVVFVLRADNRGEGGALSLMALALRKTGGGQPRARGVIIAAGLFATALLYGDGMITPAISVLAAVEGLEVVSTFFEGKVLYISVVIILGLFLLQSFGTHRIGKYFGPLILIWFTVIGCLGVRGILMAPEILGAINPIHAIRFLIANTWTGFVTLSAVFLTVTGGEALYTDMGHFGRRPIRVGWYTVVLPALLLSYFGQTALLLASPEMSNNPFFNLAPASLRLPIVVLATMAAAVASQAVISGAFSLTKQAVSLGYLPRMEIRHTSDETIGQIYVPQVNWGICAMTLWLVLQFRSSTALEGAYGLAVSCTMVVTSIMMFFVARRSWGWSRLLTFSVLGTFLVADLAFLGANATKIVHGGWFPLTVGVSVYLLMTTWRAGRELMLRRFEDRAFPVPAFLADVKLHPPLRVPGISVFMTSSPDLTPVALLHNVKNNRILHETVVLLAVTTEEIPYVRALDQVQVEDLGEGFHRVTAHYGFMDTPDIQQIMDRCRAQGYDWPMGKVTFFLGRTTIIPSNKPGMATWRKKLFRLMTRNSERATAFFRIPPGRVVELGMQVEM